jgi:hypothetical protein
MRARILSIPLHIRRVLYTGPFFVLWVIGYTVETSATELRAAGRGLVTLIGFVASHAVILFVRELIRAFTLPAYPVEFTFFLLKSLIGLGYLGLTVWIAVREYRNQETTLPFIDRLALHIDSVLSR